MLKSKDYSLDIFSVRSLCIIFVDDSQDSVCIIRLADTAQHVKGHSLRLVLSSWLELPVHLGHRVLPDAPSSQPLLHQLEGDVDDHEEQVLPQHLPEDVPVRPPAHCKGDDPVPANSFPLLLDVFRHQLVELLCGSPVNRLVLLPYSLVLVEAEHRKHPLPHARSDQSRLLGANVDNALVREDVGIVAEHEAVALVEDPRLHVCDQAGHRGLARAGRTGEDDQPALLVRVERVRHLNTMMMMVMVMMMMVMMNVMMMVMVMVRE